jgi:hypothetical protein
MRYNVEYNPEQASLNISKICKNIYARKYLNEFIIDIPKDERVYDLTDTDELNAFVLA